MRNGPERIQVGEFTTIYKRGKKGNYTADFHHDGEHCRRSLRTSNLRIARQRARELEREVLDGRLGRTKDADNAAPTTTRQSADEFLAFLKTEKRRPKTRKKYQGILHNLARFAEIQRTGRLVDVDMRLIDRFRAHRRPLIGDNPPGGR